jgi:hypothetical protein
MTVSYRKTRFGLKCHHTTDIHVSQYVLFVQFESQAREHTIKKNILAFSCGQANESLIWTPHKTIRLESSRRGVR